MIGKRFLKVASSKLAACTKVLKGTRILLSCCVSLRQSIYFTFLAKSQEIPAVHTAQLMPLTEERELLTTPSLQTHCCVLPAIRGVDHC